MGRAGSHLENPEATCLLDEVVKVPGVDLLGRRHVDSLFNVVEGLLDEDFSARGAKAPHDPCHSPPEPPVADLVGHARGVGDGGEVANGAEVGLTPLDHLNDVGDVEASVQPAKHARLAIDGDWRHIAALGDEVAQDTGAMVRNESVGRGAVGARQQLRHGTQSDDGKGAAVADHVVAFGHGNIPTGRQRAGRKGT